MSDSQGQLLGDFLRDVSRSFYLTLRVLPGPVRRQIGLAYLLARTTDTIADTELISVEKRLASLKALRARIAGSSPALLDFGELAPLQASTAERCLLLRCEEALGWLKNLGQNDQHLVRQVLDVIVGGQELDLQRFGGASGTAPVPIQTDRDLDDYTYRVAGCVGEFWTNMCLEHLFPEREVIRQQLLALGVSFGKGLQLVNILRDLPEDLRRGRCYLPQEKLAPLNLSPADLLDSRNESRLRPLYDSYLDRAVNFLKQGWDYTNLLPRRCVRVRLACAWPVLLGLETLELLSTKPFLEPGKRIKVGRKRVRSIMLRSIMLLPFAGLWRNMARVESLARVPQVQQKSLF